MKRGQNHLYRYFTTHLLVVVKVCTRWGVVKDNVRERQEERYTLKFLPDFLFLFSVELAYI